MKTRFNVLIELINFNLGLKGYSVSRLIQDIFIKDLILCYEINRFLPAQIRRPVQRTACRILTIRKRTKHSVYFSSFLLSVSWYSVVCPKSPRYRFISCRMPSSTVHGEFVSDVDLYGCSNFFFPITSPRAAGLPTESSYFLAHGRRRRIAKICVSDVARLMRPSGIADERGWLMGGRKTKGCRLERCRDG